MSENEKEQNKKMGGWVRLSSKEVYDNPWIKVRHEEVLTPAGSEGIYGVVHFKSQGIGIIPIDENNNTWLVKQSRYTLGIQTWEIPEGGSPHGEDPLETAKRELEEETGLLASNWRELLTMHLSNSVTDEVGIVFVATGLSQGTQSLEDSEDIQVKKLPLKEAIEMVKKGEITDSLSVAGLLRLALDLS